MRVRPHLVPIALLAAGLPGLTPAPASAQGQAAPPSVTEATARPPFRIHSFDEDWRPLADPAQRTEPLDDLKFVPVGETGWLTLGGEQRFRFERYGDPRFGFPGRGGAAVPARDDYLLSRTLLHADLHVTPNLRAFVQLGAHSVFDEDQRAAPANANALDLAQAFIDGSFTVAGAPVLVRAGRQEMGFGSQRLVSIREGTNTRQTFDGVRVGAKVAGVQLDAFATRPVAADHGSFDDRSSGRFEFYGVYATVPLRAGVGVDLYHLGLTRPDLRFTQIAGDERRHTVGTRLFGRWGRWDWDLEAAYQFGEVRNADIRAWTVANEVGYRPPDLPWAPRLFLRADVASGDGDLGDGTLGTFEAPFPKLPYLTEAGALFTPQNIMDLHPGVTLQPARTLTLSLEYAAVWKHRSADAFYLPPGAPVPGTAGGPRFAAHLVQVAAAWSPTPQLTFNAAYVRAFVGEAIRTASARDADFLLLNASARF